MVCIKWVVTLEVLVFDLLFVPYLQEGMTAADIACTNRQTEVHQELLNSGAPQGSLIEPQVGTLPLTLQWL